MWKICLAVLLSFPCLGDSHSAITRRESKRHEGTPPWLNPDAYNIDMKRWKASPEDAEWSALPEGEVREMVEGWYTKYAADLEKVRERARQWPGKPQSGDLEMAISYLRLRATKPAVVWECAPADGFSSFFILSALKDNGAGHLYSFGIEPEKTVFGFMNSCCTDLSALWSYREGVLEDFVGKYDFENGKGGFHDSKGYVEVPMPQYVYMDALHNYEFGKMYASLMMSKVGGHVHVSMHDAFRDGWSTSTPQERELFKAHPHRPMPEAQGVIDVLKTKICRGFTFSRSYSLEFYKSIFAVHQKFAVHPNEGSNPTFYFELGC